MLYGHATLPDGTSFIRQMFEFIEQTKCMWCAFFHFFSFLLAISCCFGSIEDNPKHETVNDIYYQLVARSDILLQFT